MKCLHILCLTQWKEYSQKVVEKINLQKSSDIGGLSVCSKNKAKKNISIINRNTVNCRSQLSERTMCLFFFLRTTCKITLRPKLWVNTSKHSIKCDDQTHINMWSQELFYVWTLKVCFVCKSNTGECQTPILDVWNGNIIEHIPNLLTMSFWRCINSKTESGGLSEGRKSPLIAQLHNNTFHDFTEMDKLVLYWWDWWWTNADFMRHQLELLANSMFFVCLFLYKKPTCKTIDEESGGVVTQNLMHLWVLLTSINQETITDTSICPEKYLKHSFFIYTFYT